jgi:flagellar basal-body rod protein FlgC
LASLGQRRQEATGVEAKQYVENDDVGHIVYDPGHPMANAEGYVQKPDVNLVQEMVTMISATRAYEANVSVIQAAKNMAKKALEI